MTGYCIVSGVSGQGTVMYQANTPGNPVPKTNTVLGHGKGAIQLLCIKTGGRCDRAFLLPVRTHLGPSSKTPQAGVWVQNINARTGHMCKRFNSALIHTCRCQGTNPCGSEHQNSVSQQLSATPNCERSQMTASPACISRYCCAHLVVYD